MKRYIGYLLLLVSFLAVGSYRAAAQLATGDLTGTVTDPSGAAVPGATVTVTNAGTNATRSETTSANGTYTITALSAAVYNVQVQAAGFAPLTAKVQITVGGHLTFDAKLTVGGSTTVVEVQGEGGAQVNTQTQELSQVVGQEQITNLPSLTRNPYDFVVLSGNVSGGDQTSAGNAQNATTRGVGFNINGQRSSGTEILLDGVENVAVFGQGIGIRVPLDGVQEYRVLTSNFEPQYGRASGGVVNVITRAGSNQFHGSAWEYNRLSAYTANTVTNAQQGIPKGKYTRNQFGFVLGGPIKRDKLFFLGSTEWTRVRSAANLTAAVPTPELLAASAANVQAFFQQYAGNKNFNFIRTYSAGEAGISNVPAATPALGVVPFTAPTDAGGGLPQNTYNILGRVDYNLTSKTQMFFRYVNYNEIDQAGSGFASPYSQYNVGNAVKNAAYLYSMNHIFTPNLLTTTRLSFSRFNTSNTYNKSLQNVPTLFVAVNSTVPNTSTPIQLPGFYDTNPANGGLPFGGPQNTAQINQDLDWTKGHHTLQFGVQLIYIQTNNAFGAYAQAGEQMGKNTASGLNNFATGNLFRFQAAVNPGGALPCVRNPYTGALTQTPGCSISLPAGPPSFARSDRFRDWAVYAQDSFKVTPRFTFDYGVRYEYYGVQHNSNPNLDSNFYFASNTLSPENIRNGQVYTVPNSPIRSLWKPQRGTVSPRVGFAYDLFGNGKWSVRGGYGISYERNFGNVTFNVIQNPPNYAVIVINNTTVTNSNAGPLAGSGGNVPLPPTSLRNVDQNIRTAQTQFWDLALEHQLANATVVSVQYAAARGVHLYDIKNINGLGSGNVLLGDPTSDASGNTGLTRLNPQYSDINNRGSNGDSYYEALNVQFQTTNLHRTGLALTANYTFSHAIDDLSSTFSESNSAFSLGYTNPFYPALDRGNSDLDIRHRLVVAPIYQTPWFSNDKGSWWKGALGGWQVTGIFTARTGTPFSYFDSTNNFSGYNVARYTPAGGAIPKRTFKSIPSGTSGGGVNSYQIGTLPAANSFGNPALLGASDWGPFPLTMSSRNAFRGPGAWNLDAALMKNIPIHENVNLVFRAEGFNVTNHHNLYIVQAGNDVANYDPTAPPIIASKGGVNGGASDERRFGQFSLSLKF